MASESTGSNYSADEPSVEVLEDLCCKFILTAPKDALGKDKLFFLVEQAWWYYEVGAAHGCLTQGEGRCSGAGCNRFMAHGWGVARGEGVECHERQGLRPVFWARTGRKLLTTPRTWDLTPHVGEPWSATGCACPIANTARCPPPHR